MKTYQKPEVDVVDFAVETVMNTDNISTEYNDGDA